MNKTIRKISLLGLTVMLSFVAITGIYADSHMGVGHVGIPVVAGDARSIALGGVSVAVQGESFVYGNPARLVNFTRAGLSGAVGQDYRSLKHDGQSQSLKSTEFFSFRGVFPSYKKFVVSAGFYQDRDMDWESMEKVPYVDENDNTEVTRRYVSDGGIYFTHLGIARPVYKNLALGLGLEWMLGRTKQTRTMSFDSDELLPTGELYRHEYSLFKPVFGFLFGFPRIQAGASVSFPQKWKIDKTSTYTSGFQETESRELDYPTNFKIGLSARVTNLQIVCFDYSFENWEDVALNLEPQYTQNTQSRFAIGYEILPLPRSGGSVPFYRKIPLRFGFNKTTYAFEYNGEKVGEYFFTFGTGNYFSLGRGSLDMAIEYGKRSSDSNLMPEENVFRVVMSLAAFETWTNRPRRK